MRPNLRPLFPFTPLSQQQTRFRHSLSIAKKVLVQKIFFRNRTIGVFFAVKYPDPAFECVSEDVLETWQKNNHTFKKVAPLIKFRVINYNGIFQTEYTMKLEVAGKTFYGSANTKKAAKTVVANEAWNIIRAGNM